MRPQRLDVALAVVFALVCAPGALAQLQFEDMLLKHHLLPDTDITQAMALQDVNGDGNPDLITGNTGQNRLYMNNGTGAFEDATGKSFPADLDDTRAVVAVDVDNDNDVDLLLGNWDFAGQQNRLYLNTGAGVFTDATSTNLPLIAAKTNGVAVGDVDGDGDPDVYTSNGGHQNRLYLNNGAGVFVDVTATNLPAESDYSQDVALGDVDGDGDLDAFVVNGRFTPQNRLYLNNGTGVFTDGSAGRMPTDSDNARSIKLGDVDSDGDLDAIVGNKDTRNRLYINNGFGSFTRTNRAVGGSTLILTHAVAFGDVDNDGDLDLAIANRQVQNNLFLNNGSGIFSNATSSRLPARNDDTLSLVFGDVDGDGDLDMTTGNDSFNTPAPNNLLLNNGAGTFVDPRRKRLPPQSASTCYLRLGDLDRDGDLDLVVANGIPGFSSSREQNRIYLNDGTGAFADATAGRLPPHLDATTAIETDDVDGDGDKDIVVANGNGSGALNRLYINNGFGFFTDATPLLPNHQDETTSVALGDVDGDDDLDIVFGNKPYGAGSNGQNRLYLNNGFGSFTDATATKLPRLPDIDTEDIALADLDGDGDLDMIVAIYLEWNKLLFNDGTGTFIEIPGRGPSGSRATTSIAIGDVDRDGDVDIAFGNDRSSSNRLYLNNGAGSFVNATVSHLPVNNDSTMDLQIRDIDGDGFLDMIAGNDQFPSAADGQNRLYLNDGTAHFLDATSRLPVALDSTWAIAAGDIDRDGDRDIFVGNNGLRPRRGGPSVSSTNTIYTNLHRQLHTPFVPTLSVPHEIRFWAKPGYATSNHTAFPVLGLGLSPVPIPLPGLGNLLLDPTFLFVLPPAVIPPTTGMGTQQLPIPPIPGLVGVVLYLQGLVVNNGSPATDSHFTGYAADAVQR